MRREDTAVDPKHIILSYGIKHNTMISEVYIVYINEYRATLFEQLLFHASKPTAQHFTLRMESEPKHPSKKIQDFKMNVL